MVDFGLILKWSSISIKGWSANLDLGVHLVVLDDGCGFGGLRREVVWPVGHRRGETKKKREMRRKKKKLK